MMKYNEVNSMKIEIIGSGFVGTAIGRGLIELGNEVVFFDAWIKNCLTSRKKLKGVPR